MIENFMLEKLHISKDSQFVKRFKSFLWRGGAVATAAFLNFAVANVADLGLPTPVAVTLGLILGEVTKYLNTK
jgi:hypothetical protein